MPDFSQSLHDFFIVVDSLFKLMLTACRSTKPIEMSVNVLNGGGHCCHLANATKRSVSGGDASLCQITLTIAHSARRLPQ